MKGVNGETYLCVTIGYYPDPVDPKWFGFVIWLELELVYFQKKQGTKEKLEGEGVKQFLNLAKNMPTWGSRGCQNIVPYLVILGCANL